MPGRAARGTTAPTPCRPYKALRCWAATVSHHDRLFRHSEVRIGGRGDQDSVARPLSSSIYGNQ
jgi:hypothetical protein